MRCGLCDPGALMLSSTGVLFRRWLLALSLLAPPLTPIPTVAQDCSVRDWDDIQGFRTCLEQRGLDAWGPWVLYDAALQTSNPTIIRLLLDAGADPNTPDDHGRTPLHSGAQNRNPMVATHLLNAGADLHAGDNEGYTPLHIAAAWSGNGRVVNLLLNRGADPLAESNDGRTPLHSALRYRAEPGTVTVLVEAGAAASLTPLQRAALDGDQTVVESLLADGADPNAGDKYGWTPVHYAVPFGGPGVVTTLLAAGADPNAASVAGGTPLHLAASQASEALVSTLLRAGADPGVVDEDQQRTPLHYAAESNTDPTVIRTLVDAGAGPGIRDGQGQLALDLARANDAIIGTEAYPRLVLGEPGPLTPGRASAGRIELTDRVRWGLANYEEWAFSATSGQRVVVTMESDDLDAYLIVLSDVGLEVASDDDGGDGLNARVEFRAPATGRYTVVATTATADQTGRYRIRVEVGGVGVTSTSTRLRGSNMNAELYYVTNRRHRGDDRWAPDGYGNEPSRDGTENLRFGKVVLPYEHDEVLTHLRRDCGFGEGDGGTLAKYLTGRAREAAHINLRGNPRFRRERRDPGRGALWVDPRPGRASAARLP